MTYVKSTSLLMVHGDLYSQVSGCREGKPSTRRHYHYKGVFPSNQSSRALFKELMFAFASERSTMRHAEEGME